MRFISWLLLSSFTITSATPALALRPVGLEEQPERNKDEVVARLTEPTPPVPGVFPAGNMRGPAASSPFTTGLEEAPKGFVAETGLGSIGEMAPVPLSHVTSLDTVGQRLTQFLKSPEGAGVNAFGFYNPLVSRGVLGIPWWRKEDGSALRGPDVPKIMRSLKGTSLKDVGPYWLEYVDYSKKDQTGRIVILLSGSLAGLTGLEEGVAKSDSSFATRLEGRLPPGVISKTLMQRLSDPGWGSLVKSWERLSPDDGVNLMGRLVEAAPEGELIYLGPEYWRRHWVDEIPLREAREILTSDQKYPKAHYALVAAVQGPVLMNLKDMGPEDRRLYDKEMANPVNGITGEILWRVGLSSYLARFEEDAAGLEEVEEARGIIRHLPGSVRRVAFTRKLESPNLLVAAAGNSIRTFNWTTGNVLKTIPIREEVLAVTLSTTEHPVLVVTPTMAVRPNVHFAVGKNFEQNFRKDGLSFTVGLPAAARLYPHSIAFSPDRKLLLVTGKELPTARVQNLAPEDSGKYPPDGVFARMTPRQGRPISGAFHPSGKTLALGTSMGTVELWRLPDPVHPGSQPDPDRLVEAEQRVGAVLVPFFSPNGEYLAAGDATGNVRLWRWEEQTQKLRLLHVFSLPSGKPIHSISFLPVSVEDKTTDEGKAQYDLLSSAVVAAAGQDGKVYFWDTASGNSLAVLRPEHPAPILSISFSPDGSKIAAGRANNTLALWKVPDSVTQYAASLPRPASRAGLEEIGSAPIRHEVVPEFTEQFLSGRIPSGASASLLELGAISHPQLATQWVGVAAVSEGLAGKGKGLDSAPRKRVIDQVDLRAQSVQDQVARSRGLLLHHTNFETKGLTPGGHPSGAESGDPKGVRTPTLSDVVEDTSKFIDGLPGASSLQLEGEGAEILGSFPDEARALMVVTHIKPALEAEVLNKYAVTSIEQLLDPELSVEQLVHRVAELNGVPIHKLNISVLTGDESDVEALRGLQATHHDMQFERLKGGTFQPALAGTLGVKDGRVRVFLRRSGMAEGVFNTVLSGLFSADGSVSIFRVVSEEVKNGMEKRYHWSEHVLEKLRSLRPNDWEAIQDGKVVFSSRQINRPVVGSYTFLTPGRTDQQLPFDVPGVRETTGDNYEAHTLMFVGNPDRPGAGYLWLSRDTYSYTPSPAGPAAGLEERAGVGLAELKERRMRLPSAVAQESGWGAVAGSRFQGLAYGLALSRVLVRDPSSGLEEPIPVAYIVDTEPQAAGLEQLGVSRSFIFRVGAPETPDLDSALAAANQWLKWAGGVTQTVELGVKGAVTATLQWILENLFGIRLDAQSLSVLEKFIDQAAYTLRQA